MIRLKKIVTCVLGNGGKRNGRTKGYWSLLHTHLCTCNFLWGKNNCAKILQSDLFIYLILITSAAWFWVCPAVSKSLAPLWSLLLFLPRQQRVYSAKRSCCNVEEWEGGKTAIGKPAAYEQSPPSAVFSLSFKIASCKERTTGTGSCHFYCSHSHFSRGQKTVHQE